MLPRMFTRRVVGSGPAERGFVCGDASQSYLTGQLLDPSNRDDRFAATVVELMRQRPAAQSPVVTRNINVKSRAVLAALALTEFPELGIITRRRLARRLGVVGEPRRLRARACHEISVT
jgi:hypothetical protein